MSNVQIRGLMKVHKQTVALLMSRHVSCSISGHRAYRGVEMAGPTASKEVHGTFVYRGRTYTK